MRLGCHSCCFRKRCLARGMGEPVAKARSLAPSLALLTVPLLLVVLAWLEAVSFPPGIGLCLCRARHSGRKTAADAVLCETHSHPPCTHHCLNASFPNKTRSRGGSHYIPFFLFILRVWSQPNSCQNFIFQAAFFSRCQPIGVESVAY